MFRKGVFNTICLAVVIFSSAITAGTSEKSEEKATQKKTTKLDSILAEMRRNAYQNYTQEYKALSLYDSLGIKQYLDRSIDINALNAVDSVLKHYVLQNTVPTYDWSDSPYAYYHALNNNLIAQAMARQTRIKALLAYALTREDKCMVVKDAFETFFEYNNGKRDEEYQMLINAKRICPGIYKKLLKYGDCVDSHSREALSDFVKIIKPIEDQ